MPPEEPYALVALWMDFKDQRLFCHGERVHPDTDALKVSWYTKTDSTPKGYTPILNSAILVLEKSMSHHIAFDDLSPTFDGSFYHWRDTTLENGLMFVLVLPAGMTIKSCRPSLIEAKRLGDRIAVFSILFPASQYNKSVELVWSLEAMDQDTDNEVVRLNRSIALARTRGGTATYDVALSFAGEDREYVELITNVLVSRGVKVFYDRLDEAASWGQNLYNYLSDIYRNRARFTIIFISKAYAQKRWTNFELQAAQARAFAESREYILPVKRDNTELPSMDPTIVYISSSEKTPGEIADLVLKKLEIQ